MFSIPRGATQNFTISGIVDEAGALLDLSTYRIYATVRLFDAIVIEKKSANVTGGGTDQIEVTGLGVFKLKFSTADTSREPMAGTIDVFIVKGASYVQVVQQPFEITDAQTRSFPV